MTTPEFRIVSAIYSLLGSHDSRELRQAADRAGLPPNIRKALESLAREASLSEASVRRSTSAGPNDATADAGRSVAGPKKNHRAQYRSRMQHFLCDRSRFSSKADMVEFLRGAGIDVKESPKSSRAAIARGVVTQIENNRAARKKLHAAVYREGNGETRGWLDLISGTE